MLRNLFAFTMLLAGALGTPAASAETAAAAAPGDAGPAANPCETRRFENSGYIVCTVDPAKADLRLFWRNAEGKPYRAFAGVAADVAARGQALLFAMNAGMYREDFSPMGLYVQDGNELMPANTEPPPRTSGPVPNFFKKPNGIFYLDDAGAHILPTDDFLKQRPAARLATQSGPILVEKNGINPIFIVGSTDRARRNGVGICADGTLRFVISQDSVNFHDFARLFRDELKCPDALFLDGGHGTGFYDTALGRNDSSWHGGYGPIFGLVGDKQD